MGEISEDLQTFLKECEESYKDRYTENDPEFTEYCKERKQQIPIEERWYTRPPRQFDRHDNGGNRDRWEGRQNRDNRGYHQRDNRDFRGERDNRGWRQRDRYNNRHNPYDRNSRQYERRY